MPDNFLQILKKAFYKWQSDRAQQKGAALAYYGIFAVAPIILIIISVGGIFFRDAFIEGEVVSQLAEVIGPNVAESLREIIVNIEQNATSSYILGAGIIIVLLGASGIFVEVKNDLSEIFNVAGGHGIASAVRNRIIGFLTVLIISVFIIGLVFVSIILSTISSFFPELIGAQKIMWQILDIVLSAGLTALLFALLYTILPSHTLSFEKNITGALVAAILFTIGKVVLGIYLGISSITSVFGAAGSLVVILMWIYYSAQIFFYGAEISSVQNKTSRPPKAKNSS